MASTICRDHSGKFLESQTEKLLTSNPLVVKAKAALLATKMASQRQQEMLILEGDSQLVIEAIVNKESPHWHIDPIIEDIKHIFASHCLRGFGTLPKFIDPQIDVRTLWRNGQQPTLFLVVYPLTYYLDVCCFLIVEMIHP